MSASVSPASAMAASQASMVSDSGGTISRRPICDAPIPVIADLSSNFSVVDHRPDVLGEVLRGDLVVGQRARSLARPSGRNSGSQTSSFCSKTTSDDAPDLEVIGVAVDDVGGQSDPGILLDGDLGHDIGSRQARDGETVVDGERRQHGPAGHRAHAHVVAVAVAADRLRRMDQRLAVAAFLDAQLTVGARGPEDLVVEGELGEWRVGSSGESPFCFVVVGFKCPR